MIRLMCGIMTLFTPGVGFAADAAAEGSPQQPNLLLQFGPLIAIMMLFFYFMSRSQKKKQKQHEQMISSITRGSAVVTAGGFFGKVCDVLEDSFIIEIAEGAKARILKDSVSRKIEGGDAPRPRKLKKKKRPPRPETAGTETPRHDAANPQGSEEGVSPEENAALFNGLGANRGESAESKS